MSQPDPPTPSPVEGPWTIRVCPSCGFVTTDPITRCPMYVRHPLRNSTLTVIEVVPRASETRVQELEAALERFASHRCAKFPKERQPSGWNCLRIRDDHRENAADYTEESNAEAEQLCDSCVARTTLTPPPDEERG